MGFSHRSDSLRVFLYKANLNTKVKLFFERLKKNNLSQVLP
jgi:hypothetical protein